MTVSGVRHFNQKNSEFRLTFNQLRQLDLSEGSNTSASMRVD